MPESVFPGGATLNVPSPPSSALFFYFPTVFPLNGGAGTPTGEAAAPLKSTGGVPNGAQMSRHVYLSPPPSGPL